MRFLDAVSGSGIEPKAFYSVPEVSTALGIPESTLRRELSSGRLRSFLPSGRKRGRLVTPEWVDEWIERGTD